MLWTILAVLAIVALALGALRFRAGAPAELPTAESRFDCARCDHRDCECDPATGDSDPES